MSFVSAVRQFRWDRMFWVCLLAIPIGTIAPEAVGATVPDAPTIGTGVPGDASASISFTPGSDGGATIDDFRATCSPGSITGNGGASPVTVTGLTNGTPYTCTVAAHNSLGWSAESAPTGSFTPAAATAPSAPTGVVGTPGNAQISVAFTASSSPGTLAGGAAATITGYTATCGSQSNSGSGSPIVVSGLTNGTSYPCVVKATNSVPLDSPDSTPSTAVTPYTLPDQPTGVSVVAGNASVSVSFSAPAFNGGAVIDNYRAECNPGGTTVSGTASPINVGGLANGTSYTCTVAAHNAAGWGAPSVVSNSATPLAATAPTAPTGVSGSPGNAQISVSFTPSSSPGTIGGAQPATITGYTATCGSQSNSGATSPIVVSGLTNGTGYTCVVRATNSVPLDSPDSSPSTSVTPRTVPDAPTIGAATPGSGTVNVAFTPNGNGGATIDSYRATCSPGAITGTGVSSPISVTGLTNGTPYNCTVAAHNTAGYGAESAASNSVTPRTVPDMPTMGSATALDASANVAFTLNFNGGATVDIVVVICTSADGGTTGSNTGTVSPILVAGLTNTKTYTCIVSAHNAAGWSTDSIPSASFIPLAPTAPTAPSGASGVPGNGQISVSFTLSSSPGTIGGTQPATITGYTATCGSQSNSGASSPIVVSGLANGTSYTCVVKATNNVPLDSPSSPPSGAVTPRTVPSAPTIGTATAGNGSAAVTFSPSGNNGGATIDHYRATCTSSNGGATGTGTGASSPISVTGLTNAKNYTCTVAAHNDAGYSAESAPSSSITPRTQVQRAFVSATNGDDNNIDFGCSTTLPCRTFTAAMQVTLTGGEILAIATGDYGTAAITKSVSLSGAPGESVSLTATGGSAVSIATAGVKVILRHLRLVGSGGSYGVSMTNGAQLQIENCVISGFGAVGVLVTTPAVVRIFDSIVRDQTSGGVRLSNGAKADIVRSKVVGNGYGGIVVEGSVAGTTTRATVTRSVIVGVKDVDTGVSAESSSSTGIAQIEITRSSISNATYGILAYSSAGGSSTAAITVSRSRINGNTTGLEQLGAGSVLRSRGNNSVSGNSVATSGAITALPAM